MLMVPAGALDAWLNTAMLAGTLGPAQLCPIAAWPWPLAAIEFIQNPFGLLADASNTVPDCVSVGDPVRLSS